MAFPLAALAIMGGAKLVGGVLKKKGQKSAAKEQYKKEEQNLQSQFESNQATESNREDDRLARMQFLGGQLKGARALSPEVLKAALARRKSAVRKGVAVDQSKGMGWGMLGDIASGVGDIAGAYIKGSGSSTAAGGSEATSLRPPIGGGSFGQGMFQRGNCPPNQIC